MRQGTELKGECRILREYDTGTLKSLVNCTSLTCVQFHELGIRRQNRVHLFGKTKSRSENKMKKTGEQDTGFMPWQAWDPYLDVSCAKSSRISQI